MCSPGAPCDAGRPSFASVLLGNAGRLCSGSAVFVLPCCNVCLVVGCFLGPCVGPAVLQGSALPLNLGLCLVFVFSVGHVSVEGFSVWS